MKKTSPMRFLLLACLLSLPALALAQGGAPELMKGFGTVGDVVNSFTRNVVTALSTLFATMAMAAFFFGLVQYIWGVRGGDSKKITAGNQFMIYGLLALFVMFSVWGIITYAQKIFGVTGSTIVIPKIQIDGSNAPSTSNSPTGLPADGTAYWRCNGVIYRTENEYLKACTTLTNTGGSPTTSDCSSIASEVQRQACFDRQGGSGGTAGSACSGIASEAQRQACFDREAGSTSCPAGYQSGPLGCFYVGSAPGGH